MIEDIPAASRLKEINASLPSPPLACVIVFGCQQNEADGERLRGALAGLGYGLTGRYEEADVVLVNTCAVRDHAEKRVLGVLGAMKGKLRPGAILGVCGCMAQQDEVQRRLKASYPYVSLVFGPSMLPRLADMLLQRMEGGGRIFAKAGEREPFPEDFEPVRASAPRAWVTIMQGCDNYCSYCIVPHVRGRERSRPSGLVLGECEGLIAQGYTELFLLGQNVNSYRPEGEDTDFPLLLERIAGLDGDFTVRFMTSHPKDASDRLFEVMARRAKIAKSLHLPLQSGSDRVLSAMNRGYTRESYLEKVSSARRLMPGLDLTSDIIVGFPGETDKDFEDTLDMLERVRFNNLFTFIFSPRSGTRAAEMENQLDAATKKERFQRLLDTQKGIAGRS